MELKSIDELKPAPYNPRQINDQSADGLKSSLKRFGDISGIVWNKRTGHIVAGHQRVDQLKSMGAQIVDGKLCAEVSGKRREFAIRVVDWSETEEKAANVAANNYAIAGEFTDDIGSILDEIKLGIGEDDFTELRLDALAVETGALPPAFSPEDDGQRLDVSEKKEHECPGCGYVFAS